MPLFKSAFSAFFGWYIKETIPEIVIAVMMYYLPH